MIPRYRFGLALAAAAVLFVYEGVAIAPLSPWPVLLSWLLESTALLSLWALCELGASRTGALGRGLRALLALLFYVGFYAIVVPSLAHTYFFESAAERRFSLLEVDLRTLAFFFSKVLPLRGTLLLAGLLALMHLLAPLVLRAPCFFSSRAGGRASTFSSRAGGRASTLARAKAERSERPLSARRVAVALGVLWTVLVVALVCSPRIPSALGDMVADVWEQLTMPEVTVDRARPARYPLALLDKSATPAVSSTEPAPRFDKVLVFVMETMTSEVMLREQAVLPASTFVRSAGRHAHAHTRYFATNQDSRTGMLSMLGSRFIPYEAYSEEGRDHYMFLAQKSTLVDRFRAHGYATAFAASQQELELVVSDLPWDDKLHLSDGEPERLSAQHLCFSPYEFEHSCEDRALLPRVLSYIDAHERVFLYQEFIWGHAAAYNEASGRTNTEYYSSYLDAVVAHLSQTGAIDRTLIVLTSDHGFRDKGLQSERSVYQIPLLFFSPRFSGSTDDRLFSHLDFKDLLLQELEPARAPARESPLVMIIGPTGTSFLTVMTQPGQFMLLKARAGERYLVHADGFADGAAARGEAPDFLRLFEDYVSYFSAL